MKKLLLWAILLVMCATRVLAMPANPDKISFRQPHSEIKVDIFLKGDERVHWAETVDGYALLHSEDGSLMYAMPTPDGGMTASNFLATNIDERTPMVMDFLKTIPHHLRFSQKQVDQMLSMWKTVEAKAGSKAADPHGEVHCLVVLFAFADQPFTYSKRDFQNLFNQVGYSVNGAQGSVHDYYFDVSFGQFSMTVDVIGPITGTRETAHYGNSDRGYQDFAEEVADSASKYINFDDYDNDGDGYIDGMHIIFAGHGEESSGNADQIWSHKWNIFSNPQYNNTIVNVYSCSPEMAGSYDNQMTHIGVICHELGHVFGSPDYYDTDYAQSGGQYPGLGKYDIMSSGGWNRSGACPAHHNPYTKIYIYHWADCDTLDTTQRLLTLDPVERNNNEFYRVNTSTPGDFFLIENRQKLSWDGYIPGSGMLVYHIHPNAHGASVENYRHPQQIYILANTTSQYPTNSPSSYGNADAANAAYPSVDNRTVLDDNSTPWFRPWSGAENHMSFTNISENSTLKTVSLCINGASPQSSNLSAHGVSDQHIRLDWNNYGSLRAVILVSESGNFSSLPSSFRVGDTLENGDRVAFFSNGSNATISGLQAGTHYYFRLYNRINDSTYSATPLDAEASTALCGASEWTGEDFESATTLPDCWEGTWTLCTTDGRESNHCLKAEGQNATLALAPVSFASSNPNMVMKFYAKSQFAGNQGDDMIRLRCRPNVNSEWRYLDSITLDKVPVDNQNWTPVCFAIPEFSAYTLLELEYASANGSTLWVDDLSFEPGYLVWTTTSDGGSVNHEGYTILQRNDTLQFNITAEPGYKFANFYINGVLKTNQVRNGSYNYTCKENINFRFTFVRNLDVEMAEDVKLQAFPNPTTGRINVSGMQGESLMLIDIYGRKLGQWNVEGETAEIDLSGLTNGIYLLRSEKQTIKIIKR